MTVKWSRNYNYMLTLKWQYSVICRVINFVLVPILFCEPNKYWTNKFYQCFMKLKFSTKHLPNKNNINQNIFPFAFVSSTKSSNIRWQWQMTDWWQMTDTHTHTHTHTYIHIHTHTHIHLDKEENYNHNSYVKTM